MASRLIRVYRGTYKFDSTRQLNYFCGNTGKLTKMQLIALSQMLDTGESFSGNPIPGLGVTTKKMIDGIVMFVSSSGLSGDHYVLEGLLINVPECDNESVEFPNTSIPCRVEVFNENGVLTCENDKPYSNGSYPVYSKYYWKSKPTLVADEVQDDPDVYKLICTPDNLQSDSIALYMAAGAGDPVLVETKPTAASIEFDAPIAELEAGTYTFTAVPVKGTASGIASTGVELVIPDPEPEP